MMSARHPFGRTQALKSRCSAADTAQMASRRFRHVALPALVLTTAVACIATTGAALPALAATPSPVATSGLFAPTVHEGTITPEGQLSVVLPLAGTSASRAELKTLAATPLGRGQSAVARRAAVAKLAPPASQREQVQAWARSKGLTVSGDAWDVQLSGSASAMANAFAVHLVQRLVPSATRGKSVEAITPTTTPAIPAALRGAITGVVGLSTAPSLMTHHTAVTPTQVHAAYGQAVRPAAGGGITVATIQLSGWDPADATKYASYARTPAQQQITQVGVDGANPLLEDGTTGDEEVALDVQAILGQAPSAKQRVYFARLTYDPDFDIYYPTDQAIVDTYAAVASDVARGLVQVVSTSWGGCEQDLGSSLSNALQSYVDEMVADGATFFAASGDSGEKDCTSEANANIDSVDVPASIPAAVGVGGTSLTASGNSSSETAWDAIYDGRVGASGGGTSTLYTDTYQTGSSADRMVPDISSDADPDTAIDVYVDYLPNGDPTSSPTLEEVGGTSLAAPTVAAQLADELSAAGVSQGIGDIHAALYAASTSSTRGADAINDITTGGGMNAEPAGPGYDMSTGLGTPNWLHLAPALGLTLNTGSTYHPITPTRVLDTRTGTGAPEARVGQGGTVTLAIPAGDTGGTTTETAVVLNVTAVKPTKSSYVSVYPTGDPTGNSTSALNTAVGVNIANLVTTQVHSGSVTFYNGGGEVDLAADLEGYYTADLTGDAYHPITPTRLIDTRQVGGALGAGATRTVQVTGSGGAPTGTDAAVVTLTAVTPSAATYLSAYPTGATDGNASSTLNPPAHVNTANSAIVPLSSDGKITIYNLKGSTQVLVDLTGYYSPPAGSLNGGLAFFPQNPYRILDTRKSAGSAQQVGRAGVRQGVSMAALGMGAVAANITAIAPTATTYVAAYPSGTTSTTSALQVRAHVTQAASAMVTVPASGNYSGDINLLVDGGTAEMAIDVFGYFAPLATG